MSPASVSVAMSRKAFHKLRNDWVITFPSVSNLSRIVSVKSFEFSVNIWRRMAQMAFVAFL